MKDTLFPWLDKRACGVLLHPTSIPNDLGIGNLGKDAKRFIDFLQTVGMEYWQICPLGPTGFGDSPYQSFSSFAGNPYLIDLYPLVAHGLLKPIELKPLNLLPQNKIDFGALYKVFWPIIDIAYERFKTNISDIPEYGSYDKFKSENAPWLEAYAAFEIAKKHHDGKAWNQWPSKYRSYAAFKKSPLFKKLEPDFEKIYFYQYLFFGQWNELKIYAKKKGIKVIGDIPIYVAPDSADTWADPENFQINKNGTFKGVAGVPPDYFSPLGQLWGNPLYNWANHKKSDYAWWKQRLKHNFKMFDVIRLDHFRAFQDYWAIPGKSEDARTGSWEIGPGLPFFESIKQELPNAKFIAEDLGDLTPEVHELRQATGLPGMAIYQFAFGSGSDNFYLPHNHEPNSVVYPGTHDNDTTLGWYQSTNEATKHHFRTYFNSSGETPQWDFIRASYASVAKLAIVPMQDLLGLEGDARMNTPGVPSGNWQWRYSPWQLESLWNESATYLQELKELYGR